MAVGGSTYSVLENHLVKILGDVRKEGHEVATKQRFRSVRFRPVSLAIVSVAALLVATEFAAQTPPTQESAGSSMVTGERIAEADREPGAWLSHGRTYDEQRFSPLAEINEDNVSRLGLAWTYDTGRDRGHEATPLVANGVMYLTTSWSGVHAVDLRNGEEKWIYDPDVPTEWGYNACCDVVNPQTIEAHSRPGTRARRTGSCNFGGRRSQYTGR